MEGTFGEGRDRDDTDTLGLDMRKQKQSSWDRESRTMVDRSAAWAAPNEALVTDGHVLRAQPRHSAKAGVGQAEVDVSQNKQSNEGPCKKLAACATHSAADAGRGNRLFDRRLS